MTLNVINSISGGCSIISLYQQGALGVGLNDTAFAAAFAAALKTKQWKHVCWKIEWRSPAQNTDGYD